MAPLWFFKSSHFQPFTPFLSHHKQRVLRQNSKQSLSLINDPAWLIQNPVEPLLMWLLQARANPPAHPPNQETLPRYDHPVHTSHLWVARIVVIEDSIGRSSMGPACEGTTLPYNCSTWSIHHLLLNVSYLVCEMCQLSIGIRNCLLFFTKCSPSPTT